MPLRGTFGDFDFPTILDVVREQRRTGTLRLHLDRGEIRVEFEEGAVRQVDNPDRPPSKRIGRLLADAGIVEEGAVEDALAEQRQTFEPLGSILATHEVVSLLDLHRYLHLQFRDTLIGLFELDDEEYTFESRELDERELAPPPLPLMPLIETGLSALSEWETLEEHVPDDETEFVRTDAGKELLSSWNEAPSDDLERRILKRLETPHTPPELETLECATSYEVARAIWRLVEGGFAVQVGEEPIDKPTAGAHARPISPAKRRARAFVRALLTIALTVMTLLLGIRVYLEQAWRPERSGTEVTRPPTSVDYIQVDAHLERIEAAIEVYRLQAGELPQELDVLVEAGLLSPESLRFPNFHTWYHYRARGTDYELYPPKF